jgi:hypothetical protein
MIESTDLPGALRRGGQLPARVNRWIRLALCSALLAVTVVLVLLLLVVIPSAGAAGGCGGG